MDEIIERLIPVIEEQLTHPDTEYVRETFERLIQEPDIDEEEAKAMISFCLADEMEIMLATKRHFDSERYQMLLNLLPAMPEGR